MKSGNLKAVTSLALFAALVFIIVSALMFLKAGKQETGPKKTTCSDCHVKDNPVHGDSELRPNPMRHPRFRMETMSATAGLHAADKAAAHNKIATSSNEPDVVMLDELVDKYGPVRFSHRTHGDMAQMSGSCWSCHHNSPTDKPHPACKTCHKVEPDRNNPTMPTLKAAYHRQCMNCHSAWSHSDRCDMCHEKRVAGKVVEPAKNPFPKLERPGRIVYNTKFNNTKVTFFHDNHTGLFNISCENCHANATCAQCHDVARKSPAPAAKAGHKLCSNCHDVTDKPKCAECHRAAPMDSYSHNNTDFPLAPYHTKLQCNACHYAHKPVLKLDTDCRSCHKGLSFKNFNHASTGFSLSPYHQKLACGKCHIAGKPMKPAGDGNCEACHKRGPKGFDHATTGFALNKYHAALDCNKCHAAGKPMKKLSTNCANCHKGMVFNGFDHASTGFALNKYHAALDCNKCHAAGKSIQKLSTNCADCHKGMAFKGFDHSSTGFTLKRYHKDLSCAKCHPADVPFTRPSKNCENCHKGMEKSFKNFNHGAATGLTLDDMHGSLDCSNCHPKGFETPPVCKDCHDDKSYPKDKPGK